MVPYREYQKSTSLLSFSQADTQTSEVVCHKKEAYSIIHAQQKTDYDSWGVHNLSLKQITGSHFKIEYLSGKENTCADLLSCILNELDKKNHNFKIVVLSN